MPHTLLGQLTYAGLYALSLFAIWKGDRLQKLAGLVLFAANVATPIIQDRIAWMDPGARFMIEDCCLLVFFLGLAIHYGRAWMIFTAGCQLLSTLSHPAAHFASQISPFTYLVIEQIFSSSVYISLGVSVLLQMRHPTIASP